MRYIVSRQDNVSTVINRQMIAYLRSGHTTRKVKKTFNGYGI